MDRPAQISFVLLAAVMALIAWLHLGTFLLSFLFGYLALQAFGFHRSKALSVALYFVAVIVISAGLIYFANLAYHTLPKIADMSIPAMVEFAEKNGIELPFTDYASLKSIALAEASEGIATIGQYAKVASIQSVLLLAGLVVALSVFINPSWTAGNPELESAEDAYSEVTRQLSIRFMKLYQSFVRVIGAQIIISAINTAVTAAFLFFNGYPYSTLLVGLVFLCGLLPIVGNLISNTVVVGVGFTISPKTGILALIFLIVIHKLEYFLNSKIIGKRIHSPMWLTLVGLVVGERLMGISGMILAPVVLDYIRHEMSAYKPIPEEVASSSRG
jgi:predicted PurR-regulated permease PerM